MQMHSALPKGHEKRSPALILTRSSAIQFLTSLTIAPITTTIRAIPTEVVLSQADGLFTDCAVNLDNIQTIQKTRMGAFITHLSLDRMKAVGIAGVEYGAPSGLTYEAPGNKLQRKSFRALAHF
jgi:mRNA interferase MazF